VKHDSRLEYVPEDVRLVESPQPLQIQIWPIDSLVFYVRNPQKNDAVVDHICSSIPEFGFKIPVLAGSDREVVHSHLRLKAAKKLRITEVPVILCDEWTPTQVKAFRLMFNRSVAWADWDEAAPELPEFISLPNNGGPPGARASPPGKIVTWAQVSEALRFSLAGNLPQFPSTRRSFSSDRGIDQSWKCTMPYPGHP